MVVQWKRFGYWADVVPRWLETGRLQLDITPEIASRDYAHGVISHALTIPGLTTRRAGARIELNLGETAVVNLGPVPTNPDDEPDARAVTARSSSHESHVRALAVKTSRSRAPRPRFFWSRRLLPGLRRARTSSREGSRNSGVLAPLGGRRE